MELGDKSSNILSPKKTSPVSSTYSVPTTSSVFTSSAVSTKSSALHSSTIIKMSSVWHSSTMTPSLPIHKFTPTTIQNFLTVQSISSEQLIPSIQSISSEKPISSTSESSNFDSLAKANVDFSITLTTASSRVRVENLPEHEETNTESNKTIVYQVLTRTQGLGYGLFMSF